MSMHATPNPHTDRVHCVLTENASATPHMDESTSTVPGLAHVMGSQVGRPVKAGELIVSGWGEK